MEGPAHTKPVPVVVRSRQHLIAQGASFIPKGAVAPTALPIAADGVTYSMAQEAAWLDADHFAVGRWDGSLSIFAFNPSSTAGPLISTAVSSPSMEGVQMIVWLAGGVFASSNDERSIALWKSPSGTWKDLEQLALLEYDPKLGVANSADSFALGSWLYLVVGHANGYVSIWSGDPTRCNLSLLTTVDVRAEHPVNPWNLHNVRGVAWLRSTGAEGAVVTGSEDGNLCVVRVPDGKILSTTVYNPAAQRGINSIAAYPPALLVANCSVGSDDKNLWYYEIDLGSWAIHLRDSVNLRVNPAAPQVFNFCTVWGRYRDDLCFFSSTEEGALWMGTIENSKLSLLGYQEVTSSLGSALAFNVSGQLVMVSYNLYEFVTQSDTKPVPPTANPERLVRDV
ncbi:hypothetical protein [Pendulispora albinea]|uniref:Uncharacterized protein n=1 Tax=Pendulispora albinea TaxID=2741071 RepID=A0ABZ2LWH0_9BACT